MRFSATDRLAEPAGTINEDRAFVTDGACWVLDAATSLTGRRFTPAATDGVWLVEAWDAFLRANVHRRDRSLRDLVREGLAGIREAYLRCANLADIDPVDRPSCAMALLRLREHGVEYFVIGDCTVVVAPEAGTLAVVSDRRVATFDRTAIESLQKHLQSGVPSFREAFERVRPLLESNRRKKNRPDGYWILEFEPEALDHALVGTVDIAHGAVLLMTDGLAQFWDTFRIESTPSDMLARVRRTGLAEAYGEMRRQAQGDPDCRHFPRLKPLDDAAAVIGLL